MATLEEVRAEVTELTTTVEAIDAKLDEVKTFIEGIKAGVVTQEQLDSLAALVGAAKAKAAAVLVETDALDAPAA